MANKSKSTTRVSIGGVLSPVGTKPFSCGGKMKACGGKLKAKGGKIKTKKSCCK